MSRSRARVDQVALATKLRAERRSQAAAQWHDDVLTRYRAACQIAACALDAAGDHDLADALLLARPEYVREVATGVAVHALRRGVPAAWDALMVADVADHERACAAFDADEPFTWEPDPSWLLVCR